MEPMTDEKLDALIRLIKDANRVTCGSLVDPDYWNDEWTECPACGCRPDGDNIWIHSDIH